MEELHPTSDHEIPDENPSPGIKNPVNSGNPTRRGFLKGLLGAGGAAALVGGQPLKELVEEIIIPEQLEKELREYTDKLKSEYDIDIDFNAVPDARGSSSPLSPAERRDFAKGISEAIELYPKSYVHSSGLKKVQAIKWLALKNQKDPMAVTRGYFMKNDPGRIVINKEDLLSHFTTDRFGWGNNEKIQTIFHHEFYHQTDPHIHDKHYNDEWNRASAAKGATARDVSYKDLFDIHKKGFTSAYGSLSGGSEDRAEVASALFTNPVRLEGWAINEPALFDKVKKIKKEFFDRSGGVMNETYWELLKKGKMPAIREFLSSQEKI